MSRPERTPVPASKYPIPYWDSFTPHFIEPRSMMVSRVLTGVASAIPAALPSSYAASTSSWVTSDPAQPARAAVIINSIIVVASRCRIPLVRKYIRYIPSVVCSLIVSFTTLSEN
ncbi:MAG: hypothetical protein QF635_01560 [Candidatus Thalassarchaeaceae archaeon]|nr:hypothetical protein [Candidatus Thalassarchaeaceae archaeon]